MEAKEIEINSSKSKLESKHRKKPVLVISGDYDGCFEFLRSDAELWATAEVQAKAEVEERGRLPEGQEKRAAIAQATEEIYKEAKAIGASLNSSLRTITAGAETVDLYVGSNRQSDLMDQRFAYQFRNGNCLKFYQEELAPKEERWKKKWNFRELRCDAVPRLSLSELKNLSEDHEAEETEVFRLNERKHVDNHIFDSHREYKGDSTGDERGVNYKIHFILGQIRDAVTRYAKDEIQYHFYDDRRNLIDGIKTYFEAHPEEIPKDVVIVLHHSNGDGVKTAFAVSDERVKKNKYTHTTAYNFGLSQPEEKESAPLVKAVDSPDTAEKYETFLKLVEDSGLKRDAFRLLENGKFPPYDDHGRYISKIEKAFTCLRYLLLRFMRGKLSFAHRDQLMALLAKMRGDINQEKYPQDIKKLSQLVPNALQLMKSQESCLNFSRDLEYAYVYRSLGKPSQSNWLSWSDIRKNPLFFLKTLPANILKFPTNLLRLIPWGIGRFANSCGGRWENLIRSVFWWPTMWILSPRNAASYLNFGSYFCTATLWGVVLYGLGKGFDVLQLGKMLEGLGPVGKYFEDLASYLNSGYGAAMRGSLPIAPTGAILFIISFVVVSYGIGKLLTPQNPMPIAPLLDSTAPLNDPVDDSISQKDFKNTNGNVYQRDGLKADPEKLQQQQQQKQLEEPPQPTEEDANVVRVHTNDSIVQSDENAQQQTQGQFGFPFG